MIGKTLLGWPSCLHLLRSSLNVALLGLATVLTKASHTAQPSEFTKKNWLTERADLKERHEQRLETVEWGIFVFVILGVIVDLLLLIHGK